MAQRVDSSWDDNDAYSRWRYHRSGGLVCAGSAAPAAWRPMPGAKALLDHEHVRMRVGQVSVPFGICVEPSNVKAAGHACPFRFRCLGCDHFRTDPSYLPELRTVAQPGTSRRGHRTRRLGSHRGTPSENEITRLRQLIRRVETDVEDLTDDERHQIHQATATLRNSRSVNIGMPGKGAHDPTQQRISPASMTTRSIAWPSCCRPGSDSRCGERYWRGGDPRIIC